MKPKTDALPGMAPQKIKELEEAADDYVLKRDAGIAANKVESQAKTKLTELMKKHGLTVYKYDEELEIEGGEKKAIERTVEFETDEPKLKVRTEDKEEDGGGE